MRIAHLLVFALGAAALLAGCSDAPTGKAAKSTGKEEVSLRIAHATEAGGDFAASERLYRQAIAADPDVVVPHIELAEFYHRHRKETESIAAFNDALKLDPKNTAIMRDLANVYINNGTPDKALALLGTAIAIDGKDPYLYNSQGVAYDMRNNYAAARQSYRTALALDPSDAMVFDANISMSYILDGEYNSAIALLVPLVDLPEATPTIRQNLSMAYGLKGESGKALKMSLKDMPMDKARENIKFYRMIAGKQGGKKHAAADLPVSMLNETYPGVPAEAPVPVSAPVKAVSIQNMQPPAPAPAPVAEIESVPSPEIKPLSASTAPNTSLPAATPSAGWILPAPVLKPE